MRRWAVVAVAGAALAHAVAATGEGLIPLQVKVSGPGVADPAARASVEVRGTITGAAGLPLSPAISFQLGEFDASLAGGSLATRGGKTSYRAPRGTAGLASFTLARKSGKFTLKAKEAVLGSLADPVPFTLDVGGKRLTALLPLPGSGARRTWRKGQEMGAILRGRVLRVNYQGGNPGIAPIPGTTFVRNDAEEPEVAPASPLDPARTDTSGNFSFGVTFTDPTALDRLDLSQVLGRKGGLTDTGIVRVTAGSDGIVDVVGFLQKQSGTEAGLSPSAPATLSVAGGGENLGGKLEVPSGAVGSAVASLQFSPYAMPVELPGALPEGIVAVAGAEVRAVLVATPDVAPPDAVPFSTAADLAPTLELDRPRWVSRAALEGVDLRIYQWKGGQWVRGPGRARYEAAADRIVPVKTDRARLTDAAPVIYAIETKSRRIRGRVVDGSGVPVKGATAFSRVGGAVTGADGTFEIPAAALSGEDLEVVQAVSEGTTTARVVQVEDAAPEVSMPLEGSDALAWVVGDLSGKVTRASDGLPVPGATVSLGLDPVVRGLVHDDAGTPDNYADDVFRAPVPAELAVASYEWRLVLPGTGEEFVSSQFTGSFVRPSLLLLEAQGEGLQPGPGAYTVRVRFTIPGFGPWTMFGGFRVSWDGLQVTLSDVQLPASWEGAPPVQRTTDGSGDFAIFYRAPAGIPMRITALDGPDSSEAVFFQHAAAVTKDLSIGPATPASIPAPTTWKTRAPVTGARTGHGAAVTGGRLHVFNGRSESAWTTSAGVHDPLAGTWSAASPLPAVRAYMASAAAGGRVYAIGGSTAAHYADGEASVLAFDPDLNSWSPVASLAAARTRAVAAELGGKVYVFGGVSGAAVLSSVEVFDPAAGTWSTKPPMPTARHEAVAAAVGSRIFVVGGRTGADATTDVLEIYDPAANSWTTGASCPRAIYGACGGAVGTRLYLFGGYEPTDGLLATTWVYDPAGDSWTEGPPMPSARMGAAAAAVGGSLFVVGGEGPAGVVNTLFEFGQP